MKDSTCSHLQKLLLVSLDTAFSATEIEKWANSNQDPSKSFPKDPRASALENKGRFNEIGTVSSFKGHSTAARLRRLCVSIGIGLCEAPVRS